MAGEEDDYGIEAPNEEAQKVIKAFVQGMVRGRNLAVLTTRGVSSDHFVQMDKKVTTLHLTTRSSSRKRSVPLEIIEEIGMGQEVSFETGVDLDDMCVTLGLSEGQPVPVRFEDVEDRDTFALCLSMFVDGRKREIERRREKLEKEGGTQNEAQKLVKAFVKKIVKGRALQVVTPANGCLECLVTLDGSLKSMSIQRGAKKDSKKRVVPLEDVEEIAVGVLERDDIGLPLDDMCVTFILKEGQAIAFQFSDEEERDTFALCLGMFVDGRRKEVEKRRSR